MVKYSYLLLNQFYGNGQLNLQFGKSAKKTLHTIFQAVTTIRNTRFKVSHFLKPAGVKHFVNLKILFFSVITIP